MNEQRLVRILRGAHSYAIIEGLSILLDDEKSPAQSLVDSADEFRVKAGRLLRMAEMADRAAVELGNKVTS